jgi:type IVB pilus formation R64 PilN family outer membrane protein
MLTACHQPVFDQTEGNVADVKLETSEVFKKQDASAQHPPSLTVNQGAYVDTSPVSLSRDPSWLQNRIVIRGDKLPFSYYSRTIAAGASIPILTKYQAGLDPAITVSISHTGSIKGALDLLASKTGYVYTIQGRTVYWQAFVTKTFDVAFMPGGTDYLMGRSSSGNANSANTSGGSVGGTVADYVSSDGSADEYSSLKGSLSVWKDLERTIKEILSPDGKVMVSESTTSVTVRDRPSNVALIGKYIENLNHNLSKQVLVKVQVLEVNLNTATDYGINWNAVTHAFNGTDFRINANYGTPISITPLVASAPGAGAAAGVFGFQGDSGSTGNSILLNALNQQGKTSVVSEPRVVCLNNQVSVVRIVQQAGYVASVENTSLAGSNSGGDNTTIGTVTSQVTPGTVITGLTLYILPKIMKNSIYLQVNADLSTNSGFSVFPATPTDGSAAPSTQVQLPNITQKHFNQRSLIQSGDTLILSGFRQVINATGAQQFINWQALGGKAAQQLNTETVVLITPIILHGSA